MENLNVPIKRKFTHLGEDYVNLLTGINDWDDKEVFNFNSENLKNNQMSYLRTGVNFSNSLLDSVLGFQDLFTPEKLNELKTTSEKVLNSNDRIKQYFKDIYSIIYTYYTLYFLNLILNGSNGSLDGDNIKDYPALPFMIFNPKYSIILNHIQKENIFFLQKNFSQNNVADYLSNVEWIGLNPFKSKVDDSVKLNESDELGVKDFGFSNIYLYNISKNSKIPLVNFNIFGATRYICDSLVIYFENLLSLLVVDKIVEKEKNSHKTGIEISKRLGNLKKDLEDRLEKFKNIVFNYIYKHLSITTDLEIKDQKFVKDSDLCFLFDCFGFNQYWEFLKNIGFSNLVKQEGLVDDIIENSELSNVQFSKDFLEKSYEDYKNHQILEDFSVDINLDVMIDSVDYGEVFLKSVLSFKFKISLNIELMKILSSMKDSVVIEYLKSTYKSDIMKNDLGLDSIEIAESIQNLLVNIKDYILPNRFIKLSKLLFENKLLLKYICTKYQIKDFSRLEDINNLDIFSLKEIAKYSNIYVHFLLDIWEFIVEKYNLENSNELKQENRTVEKNQSGGFQNKYLIDIQDIQLEISKLKFLENNFS